MWWWLNSGESRQRNTKSRTELALLSLSENLVGTFSRGLKMFKEKESAMSKRESLWLEWNGKLGSQILSLMLKSPVMMMILWMLVSVSFRYFKAD